MLRICNLTFPGSSVANGSLGSKANLGSEQNCKKASRISVVDGRSLGFLFQHFRRNSQTPSSIPSGFCGGSPIRIFSNAAVS